jgi:hypothetical protein
MSTFTVWSILLRYLWVRAVFSQSFLDVYGYMALFSLSFLGVYGYMALIGRSSFTYLWVHAVLSLSLLDICGYCSFYLSLKSIAILH